jgi:hypothetical protein
MVTCDACLRANPPTRANCLYCGAGLTAGKNNSPPAGKDDSPPAGKDDSLGQANPVAATETDSPGRAQSGFYIVLSPSQTTRVNESSQAKIAETLHLQSKDLERALELGTPVPLSLAATAEQAKMLIDQLSALGIQAEVFVHDQLHLNLPVKKIRALEVSDDRLTLTILNGGTVSVDLADLVLMVMGRLMVSRLEKEERRRRGRSQPVDSRELFSDEPLVDLYSRTDEIGCRIAAGSFDFSCLGAEKSMTAFENFTKLIALVRARAPNVEIDDSYRALRPVLANIWPLEPQTRKGEWRRAGAGKLDVSTVTSIDNETQFNSYSRLRRHVKFRQLEGGR